MNAFQTCRNTADAVPLYLPQQLFLKPTAHLNVSIKLPNLSKLDKSISHWEIMEKLRSLARPDEFSALKVLKTTVEFVRFEAELDNKTRLDRVISKLDCNTIKLKDIPDLLRLRAAEAKSEFPTRHRWDSFFQDAKDMDEMKPGQRPDTIHISNLPIKWFVPYHMADEEDITPSEKMFFRIFEKFGPIRYVDIPICDPYRKKMKDHISGIKQHSFEDKQFFEGYVQFKDYIGFCNAMDALKGMKLIRKEDDEAFGVNIKVDFDRSKHLTDASIRRREIVRDRLVKKQKDKEEKEKTQLAEKKRNEKNERRNEIEKKAEKEQRRREREEKRKAKILDKLKINGCDELNEKIAKEEKKLLKAQRKLEAIRVIEELFRRIKEKKGEELNTFSKLKKRHSGNDELRTYKNTSELEVITQRQQLHSALEGRIVLKSILSGKKRTLSQSSATDSDADSTNSARRRHSRRNSRHSPIHPPPNELYSNWYPAYSYAQVPPPTMYEPPMRGHPANYLFPRGRRNRPGPSRGRPYGRGFGRYRGLPPEVEDEYMKYFSKFLNEHDIRHRTRSRSRRRYSRSRSYRSRSRSRRSRSVTYHRSRRSYRSESRFTPPITKRNKSRSRDESVSRRRSRSVSKRRSRSRTRDKSASRRSRSREKSASRRRSRSVSKRRSKSRSNSKAKSVDSSKFIAPNQMRRDRSKSWSMPRSADKGKRSWSKSPEKK